MRLPIKVAGLRGTLEYHQAGDVLWIDMFGLRPEDRNQGGGRIAWQEFESSIPKEIAVICLFAGDTGGGPSAGFWEKMGFTYQYDQESGTEYDQYMWKGANGHPTPKPLDTPDEEHGYDIHTGAKKVKVVKTPGFVIEVPQERRKKFFIRPKAPLEYWAFKNRPRVFLDEKLIFTFNKKPMAEAVVVRVEGPGHGEGEYKHYHKVYWKPTSFKKFRVTASGEPEVLYHITRRTNRQSILKNGLVPQIKEYKNIDRKPGVFFFGTIGQAKEYGFYHAQFLNQALDVWECRIPEGYPIYWDEHEDMDDFDAWVSNQPLLPENLRVAGTILVPTSKTPIPPFSRSKRTSALLKAATNKKFYHGTKKKNLDDILKNGLRVEMSEAHTEWNNAIYLACDAYTAANYEGMHGQGEPWVILEIDGKKLDEYHMRPDDYDFPDLWEREGREENWALQSWQTSLKVSCQIAYLADIPTNAIKVYQGKTRFAAESDMQTFYHGTTWEAAKNIDKTGIKANKWQFGPGEFVWVAIHPGQAYEYGQSISWHELDQPERSAVVTFDWPYDQSEPDPEHKPHGDMYRRIPTNIPRSAIKKIDWFEKGKKVKTANFKTAEDKIIDVGDGDEYWAGEGNAASGVLPVCPSNGTVCLAWRSQFVMSPGCWGTIGGAVQKGKSPQQSAKVELKEEMGYSGGMTLIPSYVFTDRGFSYHNFIGVVSNEFSMSPSPYTEEQIARLEEGDAPDYQYNPGWETDSITWVPYAEVVADMEKNPSDYHPGVLKLFANSKDAIERALKIKKHANTKIAWQEIAIEEKDPKAEDPLKGNLLGGILDTDADLKAWAEHEIDLPPKREKQRLNFVKKFHGKKMAVIDDMRVFDRGKGWGTKIISQFIDKARAAGCDGIILQAGIFEEQEKGFDLVAWYGKLGFDTTGHSGELPLMVKWLKPQGKKSAEGEEIIKPTIPEIETDPDFEFNRMRDWLNSLEWRGRNPWYPEKYPWLGTRLYSDGWVVTNDLRKEQLGEGKDLASLKQFLSKYLQELRPEKSLRTPAVKTIDVKSGAAVNPIPCPSGKRKFYDETSAIGPHKRWDPGTPPLRAYKCLCGWWHLTSKPQRTAAESDRVYTPQEVEAHFRRVHDSDADLRFTENYTLKTVAIKDLVHFTNLPADNPRVAAYMEKYKEGSPFPPVILNSKMDVRDGSHRVSAAIWSGLDTVQAFVPVETGKTGAAHTQEYAQKLIETLKKSVDADFKVIGSVEAGQESDNDLDIMVNIHADAVFEDESPWVETSGLSGAMKLMGFDYEGPSDFSPEESAEKSEMSGKYLDPAGSGIEKFFNPTTHHTVEFWFTESSMPKEADWKSKYVLPTALALGLSGAPAAVHPGEATTQQIEQKREEQTEAKTKAEQEKQIDAIIEAISRAEGANPLLNNPGNIVDFNTGKIRSFDSWDDGRDALEDQLNRIADGDHPYITPDMTLREAGMIYSNGDPNWAKNVSSIMHVPQNIKMGELIRGRAAQQADAPAPSSGKAGAWLKKAAGFAFKSFKKLWHVGTMNPKDKRDDSYEGAGLSVSVNPEEWQQIARIGGDLWEFTKPGNKFVNFHRLSKAQRKQIADWGVENGYAQPAELWRHSFFDEELDDWRYSDYATKAEAEGELGSGYDQEKVEPVKGGLTATPKLSQKSLRGKIDPLEVMDLLVTAYAEDELDCDGVWWADDLDPENLSAPRGVIFPSKLSSWKAKKTTAASKFASSLTLYHGSQTKGLSRLDLKPGVNSTIFGSEPVQRSGIFLTPDKDFAASFAGKNGEVTSHKVNFKNIADLTEESYEYREDMYAKLEAQGIDRHWLEFAPVKDWERFDDEDGKLFVDALKKSGYDGAKIKDEGGIAYIAFSPDQISPAESTAKHAAEWKFLPATAEWVKRAKLFLNDKLTDLNDASHLASMFAQKLFGGKMVGTAEHQALSLGGGKMLDLTDLYDPNTFHHDPEFWENPEHEALLKSYEPRVQGWADEFMNKFQIEVFKTHNSSKSASAEPGLLFRAPEDNQHHDYIPSWDYEIDETPDPELSRIATAAAKTIYTKSKEPFELWACKLEPDAVAIYINGTCGYPVILLDLEKHRGYEDQLWKSIDHELKHAVQEAEGRDFDEEEAESDS